VAIRAADAARAERTAAVEGLRMAMLRLSSGLGSPEVTRREVDAARALIAKSG
jgi:hypothetical protein